MVRRLKQDLREINNADFPERKIIAVKVDKLPEDAPELVLAQLLQEYRSCREARLKEATKSSRAAAMLVITSLQKRLLSSIEAFARTLKVHQTSVERQAQQAPALPQLHQTSLSLLQAAPGNDDERAELPEEEVELEEEAQMESATRASGGTISAREIELLDKMSNIATKARYRARWSD